MRRGLFHSQIYVFSVQDTENYFFDGELLFSIFYWLKDFIKKSHNNYELSKFLHEQLFCFMKSFSSKNQDVHCRSKNRDYG